MFTFYPFPAGRKGSVDNNSGRESVERFAAGRNLWLACGVFDGVHRGHQALLAAAVNQAREGAGAALALSFSPHPLAVLDSAKAPVMLTDIPLRLKFLEQAGLDGCAVVNFNAALQALPPGGFMDFLAENFPDIRGIIVGADWRFGCHQAGNVELLRDFAVRRRWALTVVPPVMDDGEKISSTRIRGALREGNLTHANSMLGRPFTVCGEVLHGRQIGRTLGVPTANLSPGGKNPLLPGSYAVRAWVAGAAHAASAYAGCRPTYDGRPAEYFLEVHLLDGDYDLYGRELTVEFLQFIRPEKRFNGVDELRAGIAADIAAAKNFFAGFEA